KIAAGAGPILIANDADGRQFKGIVDGVWLNTLAAPADVIQGLTCIRRPPVVAVSPAMSPPQVAGAQGSFDVAVTNTSSAACPADAFAVFSVVNPPLRTNDFGGTVVAAPGATAHATVNVASSRMALAGSYPFEVVASVLAGSGASASASATYVIGTG